MIQFVLMLFICFLPQMAWGQNWDWINPLPQGNTLHDVKFYSTGCAVVVGDASTVLRTEDSGQNWNIAYKVAGLSRNLRGLSFSKESGIAVGDSGTVITTNDGGQTWSKQESGTNKDLLSVFMPNDTLAVAVGEDGTILRTNDLGVGWQLQESGVTADLCAVTFIDSFGVAVGYFGAIVFSYDAGSTWTVKTFSSLPDFSDVYFLNKNYGSLVSIAHGVFLTIDGGLTWSQHSIDTEGGLHDIDFDASGNGIIAGTFGLFMSSDSGKTWSPPPGGVLNEHRGLKALDLGNDKSGIAVGAAGTILRKLSNITNWTLASQGLVLSFHDLAFVNENIGIAVTSENLIYTFDSGQTWNPFADDTLRRLDAIDFADENHGTAVGSFNQIFRTDDGGISWGKQMAPLVFNHTFLDVFHVSSDTAFIVGEFGKILATVNGGETWFEQESGIEPGGASLNAVFFTDSKHGIIVSEGGDVLQTTDGGAIWFFVITDYGDHLRDVYFTDNSNGVIVGNDGLVLKTSDGGSSWVEVNRRKNTLSSVDFYDENIGFAVGQRGEILRTADGGLSWFPEQSKAAEWLRKVLVLDANNVFAIGSRGTILKKAGGVVSVRNISSELNSNQSFQLKQNYPNPFNATTRVSFNLPTTGHVILEVFNIIGKKVATVFSGQLSAGQHILDWDSDNSASGEYFLRIEFHALNTSNKLTQSRKMLLLK